MAHDDIADIVATCEQHWVDTRVLPGDIATLRRELISRLEEASAAGRSPKRVVGRDVILYAESMASQYRVPPPVHPPLSPSERTRQRWTDFIPAYGWVIPIGAVTMLLMIFGPKETKETPVDDPEFWQWMWLGIAVFLGVGEMLTAGFFMLPFAIGAGIAALLAWADVGLVIQLIAFITTSLIALYGLRRFAWSDREPSYPVGVKRFINAQAVVTETIDVQSGTGRARLDNDTWRATNDAGDVIEPGTVVRVVEVRGTHLVVERMPSV